MSAHPFAPWLQPLAGAAVSRLALLANHVLASEPAATERLKPFAGRVLEMQLRQWPAVLPPWPPLVFRITAAGLLEWAEAEAEAEAETPAQAAADLTVSVDASNPALLAWQGMASLWGQPKPAIEVAGDAALAAEVNWLAENLRWDVADDLQRILGPGPALAFSQWAKGAAQAIRGLAQQWAGRP
jgi:ubiquinone biosynthesis protein UbiJ